MRARTRAILGLLAFAGLLPMTGCESSGGNCEAILDTMNAARTAAQEASAFSEDPASPGGVSVTDAELAAIRQLGDAAAAATDAADEAGCL
jgi:hypothetical protein